MTFSDNEPINFKMRLKLLPQIQGKTLLIGKLWEEQDTQELKLIYDKIKDLKSNAYTYKGTLRQSLRQQRIISFNRWVDLTNTKEVIPGGEFEEEIMKGRAPLIFKPFPCSN